MGKWKAQDRTVCIRGTVVCGQAEDDAECGIIVDAHNADIDALTAERDELQRRLDAVVASLSPKMVDSENERSNELASILHSEYNEYPGDQAIMKKYRDDTQEALMLGVESVLAELHARALAIAEGRTE